MNRQETFERVYAEAHGMPLESFHKYRMGDTYRLPMIAKCWRFWNLALDSVAVELPKPWTEPIGLARVVPYASVVDAIEEAGLKVAP